MEPLRELTEDEVNIAAWRIKCLSEAGYDADVAGRLAAVPDLDLHRAVELKANGCPQKLAEEILT